MPLPDTQLFRHGHAWDGICPLQERRCESVKVCARKRECKHTALMTRLELPAKPDKEP